jgi:hypothetical protein
MVFNITLVDLKLNTNDFVRKDYFFMKTLQKNEIILNELFFKKVVQLFVVQITNDELYKYLVQEIYECFHTFSYRSF